MRTDFIPRQIDEYIAQFPDHTRIVLEEIRQTIRTAAPQAQECISYQIPTFKLKGNLVHFAAHKNHFGFYPGPSAVQHFQHELKGFSYTKGTIQFPVNQPVPYDLLARIVAFRVKENLEKSTKIQSGKTT